MNVLKRITIAASFLALILAPIVATSGDPAEADIIYMPSTWNGYKIYLSQAHVSGGDNTGCDNYSERSGSNALSWEAANGAGWDLRARGYQVRVGTGGYSANIGSSNSWGSDYHIPLHSNAGTWNCSTSAPLSWTASGTIVMYYPTSTHGQGMSGSIASRVGSASPGQGQDKKLASTCCSEITQTSAYAAYMESAYHTFRPDVDWLRDEDAWAWRIGWSVDYYLGYP